MDQQQRRRRLRIDEQQDQPQQRVPLQLNQRQRSRQKKEKKNRTQIQQQLAKWQKQFQLQKYQDSIFDVLQSFQDKTFQKYHNSIEKISIQFGQNLDLRTLQQDNLTNLQKIQRFQHFNNLYRQNLRKILIQTWKQMRSLNKIANIDLFLNSYSGSSLFLYRPLWNQYPQDQRNLIISGASVPRTFVAIPKINFITFLHGAKSVSIQKFSNQLLFTQLNRLLEYLALVRFQNFKIYDSKYKGRPYYNKTNVVKAIAQIYGVRQGLFSLNFMGNKNMTFLWQSVLMFEQTLRRQLKISLTPFYLKTMNVGRQDIFSQKNIESNQWTSQNQRLFLQRLDQMGSLANAMGQSSASMRFRVSTLILDQMERLNKDGLTYQLGDIPYNQNPDQPWNQKFISFRQLARKRYFFEKKKMIQQQLMDLVLNQQPEIQPEKSVIFKMLRYLTVGICAKMRQYLGIVQKIKKQGQYSQFRLNYPTEFQWKFYIEILIQQNSQRTIQGYGDTTIRFHKSVKIKRQKFFQKRRNSIKWLDVSDTIQNIVQKVAQQVIQQLRQFNSWYHQLWAQNPQVKISIIKFDATSSQIKPIVDNMIFQNRQYWVFGVVYHSSSLRNFIWRSNQSVFVTYRKIWTVYADKLQQSILSQFQQKMNMSLRNLNCFQQIFIIINFINNFMFGQPTEQSYVDYLDKLKKDLTRPYLRYILINQDIYSLCHLTKFNLFFLNPQCKLLNIECNPSKYAVQVYSTHAQIRYSIDFNKIPIHIMQKIDNPQASLTCLKAKIVNSQVLINNYKFQLGQSNQKLIKTYINTSFAYMDIQTYTQQDKIMDIYLCCLIFYTNVQIQQKPGISIENEQIGGFRKVVVLLTKQSLQYEWFFKKCSSLKQLIAWLMVTLGDLHFKSKKQSLIWWTFNGLKFDYVFLIQEFVRFATTFKTYGIGRQCKGMRNKFFTLQDARNFFPSGNLFSLSQQNNVKYKKKQFPIDKITNQQQYLEKKEQIDQYCTFDCLSLEQLITNFFANLYKMFLRTKIQMVTIKELKSTYDNINFRKLIQRPTASNVSLYFFRCVFLEQDYVCPDTQQQIEQQKISFSGGMVQIYNHFIRQGQKIYEGDANSMYPSMMKYLPIWPYVNQSWNHNNHQQSFINCVKDSSVLRQFFFDNQIEKFSHRYKYFMQSESNNSIQVYNALTSRYLTKFIHFNKITPYQPKLNNGSLWYVKWLRTQRWVSGFTIFFILANGGQVQIQKVRFRSSFRGGIYTNPFYQYASLCYDTRLKLKKEKNTGLADCYKLMLNSLYGKLLQKLFNQINLQHPDLYQPDQQLQIIRQGFGICYRQGQSDKRLHFSGDLITIGSTITQLSRFRVSQIIQQIGLKNCYYGDTDSIYFNEQGKIKFQNLRLNFKNRDWNNQRGQQTQCSLFGNALGQWKVQNPDYPFIQGVFISRKSLILRNQHINSVLGLLNFNSEDQLVQLFSKQIQGKKFYNSLQQIKQAFQYWRRDKFFKVRLKGINFKPTSQQCKVIMQVAKKTYSKMFQSIFCNEKVFPLAQKLDIEFLVNIWKKYFFEKQKGVEVKKGIKNISFNFKRIPLLNGETLAINGYGLQFKQFEK